MKLNKIFTCVMASFIAIAMPWQASSAASSHSKKTSTSAKSTSKASSSKPSKESGSKKSTTTKSSGKAGASKANSSKASKSTEKASSHHSSGKTASASSDKHCQTVKVKTRKGYQNKKECSSSSREPARNAEPREPALTGGVPVVPSADAPVPEVKARSAPDRAYAVDGSTFFYQGRKFHVKGVNSENIDTNSDLAKQKLQMALDKGSISTDSLSEDSSGTTDAVVRINGRNLADMLKTPE